MEQQDPTPIVLDTSILLNFVKIGRVELLGQLGTSVVLLDQILDEVRRPDQRKALSKTLWLGAHLIYKAFAIQWRLPCLQNFGRVDGLEPVSALFCPLRLRGIGSLGFRTAGREQKASADSEDLVLYQTEDLVLKTD